MKKVSICYVMRWFCYVIRWSCYEHFHQLFDLFIEQLVSEPTQYKVVQKVNILDLVLTNNLLVILVVVRQHLIGSQVTYRQSLLNQLIIYCDPLGMSDHVSLLIYLHFESTHNSKLPKLMYYNGKYFN